ncbi:MAG: AI-2E family transporter [Candidatus Thiothrix moscowensis]|nr:AI-2E family transporter [Candidatus Thiothrix moscowensis]
MQQLENHATEQPLVPAPHQMQTQAGVRWELLLPIVTRVLVWGAFFGLLALLSSFFTLIFLTFVFAYLQSSIVDLLARRVRYSRIPMVVLTGVMFLSVIITVGVFVTPKVYQQATGFAKGLFVYMEQLDKTILDVAERYPIIQEAIPELRKPNTPAQQQPAQQPVPEWATGTLPQATPTTSKEPAQHTFQGSPTSLLLGVLTGGGKPVDGGQAAKVVLDHLTNISRQTVTILSTFLLALLFSFLIVLDLPRLSASVRELENTRLRFVYVEVANNIYEFGKVLGHAMQAQFYIACVNTFLTSICLQFLGMGEHIAFLAVIVFLFSFVPVAGVFISSIPICLIALNMGGINLVLLVIGMIIFIHMVEGYILNPMIYGARLRVNPVIVLIILTVGGKLFHIWGLILGLPVCTYLFNHAIRYKPPKP